MKYLKLDIFFIPLINITFVDYNGSQNKFTVEFSFYSFHVNLRYRFSSMFKSTYTCNCFFFQSFLFIMLNGERKIYLDHLKM